MPIKKPYYGLHQIVTGQYTPGNEFILDDGSDYIGTYHVLPNTQLFTGARPDMNSKQLYPKRLDLNADVKRYNRVTDNDASKYVSPIAYQPFLTGDDYEVGEIERFFVQKRNNPIYTIVEIDANQFNSINVNNSPGINGVIWNSLLIPWKISNIPKDDAATLNRRRLVMNQEIFRGIGNYITNVLEFYR